jgi:hypothetical protein
MIPITLNKNISYNLQLSTNSSILNTSTNTTINTDNNNVASGGNQGAKGDNNVFGKGVGGYQSAGPFIANSGSGYGAGGGGGSWQYIWPSGGGGGFDPNLYYNITPSISGVPESDTASKTIDNIQIGLGKPAVLFLEVTKP